MPPQKNGFKNIPKNVTIVSKKKPTNIMIKKDEKILNRPVKYGDMDTGEDENFSDDVIAEEDFNSADEPGDGDVDSEDELTLNADADEVGKINNEQEEEERDAEDDVEQEQEEEEEQEEDSLDDNYDDDNYEEPFEGYDKDDSCMYKFTKKKNDDDDDDDDDDNDELHFEDDNIEHNDIVPKEQRQAKPVLTKYERVRILGDRAKQISLGAKPMLLNVDDLAPKDIARLELERGVMPFIIEKIFPDGRRERWKVSELEIVN